MAQILVLVDGGPDPTALAALGKRLPLSDRTLGLVVLTNPYESHLAGLIPVLERYKVTPFVEGKPPRSPISIYGRCLKLIEEKGIARKPIQRGMRIRLEEELEMAVLNPGSEADTNDNSVVLRLTYGEASFILASDIEEGAEAAILASRMDLASTVLKVSSSLSSEFLNAVRPQLAIVPGGLSWPRRRWPGWRGRVQQSCAPTSKAPLRWGLMGRTFGSGWNAKPISSRPFLY